MSCRRSFIAGMLAAGLYPAQVWADAGAPAFISAGMKPDGTYVLCGVSKRCRLAFEIALPGRGHAAAAHPKLAEAVVFARRPGLFALVINCVNGRQKARLTAPSGRHFNGHGAFSNDGSLLFTTENDYEAAKGAIGIWTTENGYRRVGEFHSGGVGPHDIKLLPDGETLVVANGGIETHPETGRTKLNVPFMRPNLTYVSLSGRTRDKVKLDRSLNRNSIRHLAVTQAGSIAFAMQWEGPLSEHPPLLGLHSPGGQAGLLQTEKPVAAKMRGYTGSVAVSNDMERIAVTSPRGGLCQIFDLRTKLLSAQRVMEDVCGVAPLEGGFLLTSGTGHIMRAVGGIGCSPNRFPIRWDNHLIPVTS